MSDTLRLLSKKQVKELVLYSYAHIDRLEAAGAFPKRVRMSRYKRGRVGWVEREVLLWLRNLVDARS